MQISNLERIKPMYRNEDGWIKLFQEREALWVHDGKMRRPHALLSSGNHSGHFFDSRKVTDDERLLSEVSSDLLELLDNTLMDDTIVDCVVGPDTGKNSLASSLSERTNQSDLPNLSPFPGEECSWASLEKSKKEGVEAMVIRSEDISHVNRDRRLLLCDDVITTGKSIELTANEITRVGGTTSHIPYILAIVNRSGLKQIRGMKIISLIDRLMPIWTPKDCPLCKQHSEPVRARTSWSRLNGRY